MIAWVASQSTAVIALVLFGAAYVLAAVTFIAVPALASLDKPADFKSITPVILTPLAATFAFLIVLLASNVWGNVRHANLYVGQEASALRQTTLLADSLPPDLRTKLRDAVRKHIETAVNEEWPAMTKGQTSIKQPPMAPLLGAMTTLMSANLTHSGQQLAQQRAVVAIEEALAARLHRIQLSETTTGAIQWLVVIVLDLLVLATLAVVHLDNARATGIAMFIWSSAVASCFLLVMVYDRPFGGGGINVQPLALQEVMPD